MRGTAVAVGNFDGVHLGHREIFLQTVSRANGLLPIALTFTPHPRNFFKTGSVECLTSDIDKAFYAESCGIEKTVFIEFDKAFSELDAKAFVLLLSSRLNCKMIVCGENFAFGKGAAYTVEDLKAEAAKFGIDVVSVPLFKLDGTVSSDRIRALIRNGEIERANALLGRDYSLFGSVVSGRRIGKSVLSVPTANLSFDASLLIPADGVYAAEVTLFGKRYPSVCNIGFRPTFSDSSERSIEAHIINFKGNCYGKELRISFKKFLRKEERFSSPEELKARILSDVEQTIGIFNN